MMFVSACKMLACLIFSPQFNLNSLSITRTNSAAANTVLSTSEMDGMLQWVEKSLTELAIRVARVCVTK